MRPIEEGTEERKRGGKKLAVLMKLWVRVGLVS